MRRLPVYLLLDVSGSMMGDPIEAVRNGVSMLSSALRSEPQALETAYISVITFESIAKQLVPLTDLMSFQEPEIEAGGATALGQALELLSNKIETEVEKTTEEKKGDWKPMVFILTDGCPTDDWNKGADMLRKHKVSVMLACLAGNDCNQAEGTRILTQIVDDPELKEKKGYVRTVVHLKSTSSSDLKAFFKWVTGSIVRNSQKLDSGENKELETLPPPPPEIEIKF